MKKGMLIFLMVLLSDICLWAQKNTSSFDFGGIAGAAYYLGDVNHNKQFYSPQLNVGLIGRYVIDLRNAVRANYFTTGLSGSDKDFDNAYQQRRDYSFSTRIHDISVQYEFNFFEYDERNKDYFAVPYVAAGLGVFVQNSQAKPIHFQIPFAIGVKTRLSRFISVGAEWGFRKTFSDQIDMLDQDFFSNQEPYPGKQKNYLNDKDWYSFAGVFLTYTFYPNKGVCKAYNSNNMKR